MTTVGDLMAPDVVTAELPGAREDVIEVLRGGDISSIPVTKDGVYRGLVSREELLSDPDEEQLAMLMREVPTVEATDSVRDCAAVMLEHEERRLPVVSDTEVQGIITLTDVVRYIADAEIDEDVGEYLEDGVHTVWQETPVNVVVETITLAGDTAACVLDDDCEMVGIITETDCVRLAEIDTSAEEVGEGVAGQDDDWMWEGIQATSTNLVPVSKVTFPDEAVKEYMAADVHTVVSSTDVSDAARRMTDEEVHHLPVQRGDALVAMLRDIDLLKALD
ncbi:MAG: CBS domain-containing protein [Halobacteriota archaeon]